MYTWFREKKSMGDHVTGRMLQQKALELNNMLDGSKTFKATSGFLSKFKKRHNIGGTHNRKKKGPSDHETNDQFRKEFSKYITTNEIPLDNVYNADATGLFWKMSLNNRKSLIANDELEASEIQPFKDRITLILCTNATGSHKLPILIVGKVSKPRCFTNVQSCPVIYTGQKHACIDRELMLYWYQEVFMSEIERVHGPSLQQCVLLLNNMQDHPSAEYYNSISQRCHVMILPPDVDTLIQPMSNGIIANCKRMYKANFIRLIFAKNNPEHHQKLLKSFDLLQCCYLVNNSWDRVTPSNIKNAWKNIFPFCSDTESQCDTSSQFLDIVNRTPTYNITPEAIKLWLDSDDHAYLNNENEDDEEEPAETESNFLPDDTAIDGFDGLNTFIRWYRNNPESTPEDWDYLYKFWCSAFSEIIRTSNI